MKKTLCGQNRPFVISNIRILSLLGYVLACPMWPTAEATPYQLRDIIEYGANRFNIAQLPLQEVVNASGVRLSGTASYNNKGYEAVWAVQDNTLFLEKFTAEYNGKSVHIGEVIPNAKLPLHADWFSGNLQLPIGELDHESQTFPVVVTLKVVKGEVVAITVKKDAKESAALNGATEDEDSETSSKPSKEEDKRPPPKGCSNR